MRSRSLIAKATTTVYHPRFRYSIYSPNLFSYTKSKSLLYNRGDKSFPTFPNRMSTAQVPPVSKEPARNSLSPFKVGIIQLNSGYDLNENYLQCERLIKKAVDKGAQFIVTPENTNRVTAHSIKVDPSSIYAEHEHPILLKYRELCAELNIWLCIGSMTFKAENDSRTSNRSILIAPPDPSSINSSLEKNTITDFPSKPSKKLGQIVARYDKIHMFDVPTLNANESYMESSRCVPGYEVPVVDTPFGLVGLTICYDVRFPYLYRALAKAGAHYIFVPSAFTVVTGRAHWHTLLRARAIENGVYIFAPAQCGNHPGDRRTFGHSLIIDPWGEILAEGKGIEVATNEGSTGEDVLVVTIDPRKIDECRQRIPSLMNDRDFGIKHIP